MRRYMLSHISICITIFEKFNGNSQVFDSRMVEVRYRVFTNQNNGVESIAKESDFRIMK